MTFGARIRRLIFGPPKDVKEPGGHVSGPTIGSSSRPSMRRTLLTLTPYRAATLIVRRSSWQGIVGAPKSGRDRRLPFTARFAAALKAHRHLRGDLVFCHDDGRPFTQSANEAALRYACKRSGLRSIGSHVLRHTFCSHLAMRGAAPKAVQELAGHSTLSMTLRYMLLAPSALREAIGLLDLGHQVGNAPDLITGTD